MSNFNLQKEKETTYEYYSEDKIQKNNNWVGTQSYNTNSTSLDAKRIFLVKTAIIFEFLDVYSGRVGTVI